MNQCGCWIISKVKVLASTDGKSKVYTLSASIEEQSLLKFYKYPLCLTEIQICKFKDNHEKQQNIKWYNIVELVLSKIFFAKIPKS